MHRLMLEASQSVDNAFVTLTYSDETSPASGSLNKVHLQHWLKRLRKQIEPARVRYFAAGEYGDKTQRPHYHVALFGYPNCLRGQSRFGLHPRIVNAENKCCVHCDLIATTWQLGGIYVGALTKESAQYVAGYVMKKMTHRLDPRLNGREPEFALMSRRPGLGVMAMHDVADTLMRFNLDTTQIDVPSILQHGKKQLPLGRFLRAKLRKMLGKEEHATPEALAKINEEMLALLQDSINDPQASSLKKMIQNRDKGRIASIENRHNILSSRKTL